MNDRRADRRGFLLALLLGAVACLPLLLDPGLVNTRAGGDSPFLLVRLQQMVVALRGGVFPVRWMPDAAYGLGYPFFNFYAPLPYYLAALFHFAGLGYIGALKLTQILGFVAATASMYLLARDLLDDEHGALLASLAYTYAPFHLVNVYVRGDSLGEFYAFAFYPLIFLALRRLRRRPSPGDTTLLALAYGGLVLSHNISALAFSPFVALWLVVCGLSSVGNRGATIREYRKIPETHAVRPGRFTACPGIISYMRYAIGGLLLGLALSAWYWAPALLERGAVHLEQVTTGYFHYAGHFRGLDLVQRQPLFDYAMGKGKTPFAMGLVQTLLALLGALAIAVRWRRGRSRMESAFLLFLLLATTWLITPLSHPLWDHLPLLPFVQFPWRLLSVQAFAASLIIGYLAVWPSDVAWRRLIAYTLGLAVIATAMLGLRVEYLPITDEDVTQERIALYELFTANIGSTVRAEYLPKAVEPRPYTSAVLLNGGVKPPPLVAEGELAGVQLLAQEPTEERWRIAVASPWASLAFYTHWFPGWRAYVGGRPVESGPVRSSGIIGLDLPQGEHEVLLRFERTPVRAIAEVVSLLSLLGALARLIVSAVHGARISNCAILYTFFRRQNRYQGASSPRGMPIPQGPPRLRGSSATKSGRGFALRLVLSAAEELSPKGCPPVAGGRRARLSPPLLGVVGLILLLAIGVRVQARSQGSRSARLTAEALRLHSVQLERAYPSVEPLWANERHRTSEIVQHDPSVMRAMNLSTLTMDFDRMPYLHPNPQGVRFGEDLRLVGYTLSAEERRPEPAEGLMAGQTLTVTLTWEGIVSGLTAELALVSPAEHLFHVPYVLDAEHRSLGPLTSFTLSVPSEANPGLYLLRLRVWSGSREIRPLTEAGETLGTTYLRPVRVLPSLGPRPFQPLASMGDAAALGSVEAERTGPDLEVRMDWQATRPLPVNYATSVRLREPDGELIAQEDKQPCYGFCPTTTWAPGLPVRDRRWLPLPQDLTLTGAHRLEIVLYDRPSLRPVDTAEFSLAEVWRVVSK